MVRLDGLLTDIESNITLVLAATRVRLQNLELQVRPSTHDPADESDCYWVPRSRQRDGHRLALWPEPHLGVRVVAHRVLRRHLGSAVRNGRHTVHRLCATGLFEADPAHHARRVAEVTSFTVLQIRSPCAWVETSSTVLQSLARCGSSARSENFPREWSALSAPALQSKSCLQSGSRMRYWSAIRVISLSSPACR